MGYGASLEMLTASKNARLYKEQLSTVWATGYIVLRVSTPNFPKITVVSLLTSLNAFLYIDGEFTKNSTKHVTFSSVHAKPFH